MSGRNNRIMWVIVSALFLTPLVFGRELLFPFVVYRTYYWFLCVEFLTLILVWRQGFTPFKRMWVNPLLRAVTIFIVVKFLTDILGAHPLQSFWGDYERMMGLVTWLHWWLLTLALTAVIGDRRERLEKLLWVVVAVGVVVAVYGLAQRYIPAFQIALADTRLFSTIGNAAVAAGFLLWAWFFSWYFLLTPRRQMSPGRQKVERLFALLAVIVMGFSLYLTATRGAALGAELGLAAFLLSQLLKSRASVETMTVKQKTETMHAKQKIWYSFALGLVLLLPLLLWLLRGTSLIASQASLRRLTNFSLTDFTSASRLTLWKMGLAAAREKWLLGYGSGNIDLALDKYFRPELTEQWFDSSHNNYLDILLAHGGLGLAAYGFLLTTVFLFVFRFRRAHRELGSILLAVAVAYLVQNFFLFDTLVAILPFGLVIGGLAVLSETDVAKESALNANRRAKGEKLVFALTCVAAAALLVFHFRGVSALASLTRGYRLAQSGVTASEITKNFSNGYKKMYFGYGNGAAIVRNAALLVFSRPGRYTGAELGQMREALTAAHEIARRNEGEYSKYYVDEAKVYLETRPLSPEALARTTELLLRARELSPSRVDIYYGLAESYVKMSDFAKGKGVLQEVREKWPRERATVDKFLAQIKAVEAL